MYDKNMYDKQMQRAAIYAQLSRDEITSATAEAELREIETDPSNE